MLVYRGNQHGHHYSRLVVNENDHTNDCTSRPSDYRYWTACTGCTATGLNGLQPCRDTALDTLLPVATAVGGKHRWTQSETRAGHTRPSRVPTANQAHQNPCATPEAQWHRSRRTCPPGRRTARHARGRTLAFCRKTRALPQTTPTLRIIVSSDRI